MSKHTPGPWRLIHDAQGPCMVMHPTLEGIAIASLTEVFRPSNGFHDPVVVDPEPCPDLPYEWKHTYHPERVANARLIAAAPELLKALKALLSKAESDEKEFVGTAEQCGVIHAARAAIAKAEGAQP